MDRVALPSEREDPSAVTALVGVETVLLVESLAVRVYPSLRRETVLVLFFTFVAFNITDSNTNDGTTEMTGVFVTNAGEVLVMPSSKGVERAAVLVEKEELVVVFGKPVTFNKNISSWPFN